MITEPALKEIQQSISEETGAYSELLRPGIRTAFLVAILLGLFNQWTGWTFIAWIRHNPYAKVEAYLAELCSCTEKGAPDRRPS